MNTFPRPLPLALALSLALPFAAAAAPAPQVPPADRHDPVDLDAIKVRAMPLAGTAEDLARPVEVLTGAQLDEAKATSLGETVSRLPGVQSSYFGPGVGRPIIRGLEGARVQVLSDGLGSGDASTVSADHAVSIEPFLADQIEVLKGPATLLYGSGAIGGAVNVLDGRIPEAPTARALQGRVELRGNTVNNERTGMARLDATSAGGRLVMHLDVLHRDTRDYDIPGFAESAEHLAEIGETPDPETAGVLPGSALRTDSGALGVSWIGDRGFIGFGSSLFGTRYGVPGHAAHEDEGEDDHAGEEDAHAEGVTIELDQQRYEMRGGLDDLGVFESLRVKFARTVYTHTEFEGDAIGTVFDSDTDEARVELVHRPWGGWRGAFGTQWSQRDFVATGDEAFVPASRGRDTGLFWIGERSWGGLKVELGARHDRNRIDAEANALLPTRDTDRRFDATSASAALKWEVNDGFHLSLGLDRAQRAPTAEELYSNGLHVATGTFEVGDDALGIETANRIEFGTGWHNDRLRLDLSAYAVRYRDFIYLSAVESADAPGTAVTVDDLPLRAWTQNDARFVGLEAEADLRLVENATGAWNLRLFGDIVRGRLEGGAPRAVAFDVLHDGHTDAIDGTIAAGGDLPRIAPARVGGELRWELGGWRASVGAIHHARQDRVAAYEHESPGYTLVDAHVAWHVDTAGGTAWELFLDGTNLLDREARPHTSFLRDVAPLPGRGIAFGVRAFF